MLSKNQYKLKSCSKAYKKKLKSINKTRERINIASYIQEVFNDLADFEFNNLIYSSSLYNILLSL